MPAGATKRPTRIVLAQQAAEQATNYDAVASPTFILVGCTELGTSLILALTCQIIPHS